MEEPTIHAQNLFFQLCPDSRIVEQFLHDLGAVGEELLGQTDIQGGGRSGVGIDIEGHVHTTLPGLSNQLQGLDDLPQFC